MSITEISTDQLRQMQEQEGMVFQGCGGSLQEWQDGINGLLEEFGVFKEGSKFDNVYSFQHEGRTCLFFPFSDELKVNPRKLLGWKMQNSEQYECMWYSDYLDQKLGGQLLEQKSIDKPDCPLIGANGNVFNLMAIASNTLKEHGMQEQAREMRQRIEQCQSYDSALSIIMDYVNPTEQPEMGMQEMY